MKNKRVDPPCRAILSISLMRPLFLLLALVAIWWPPAAEASVLDSWDHLTNDYYGMLGVPSTASSR